MSFVDNDGVDGAIDGGSNTLEQQGRKFDITALGELLIDFTDAGENQDGRKLFERNPGGAPANVVVNAQRAGMHTAFIGKIGDDVNGRYLHSFMHGEGIDCSGIIMDPQCQTTMSFVELGPGGERSFSFERRPGSDMMLTRDEVSSETIRSIIRGSKVFHIGTLSLTDEPVRSATLEALRIAKAAGCVISFDPNYRADLWRSKQDAGDAVRLVIPYASIVKLSDTECDLATGTSDPVEAATLLVEHGVDIAAITLGERGAYVRCKDGGAFVVAGSVDVVDTTGAGDAFFAGFLSAFVRYGVDASSVGVDDLRIFAQAGNECAAACIKHRGAM